MDRTNYRPYSCSCILFRGESTDTVHFFKLSPSFSSDFKNESLVNFCDLDVYWNLSSKKLE